MSIIITNAASINGAFRSAGEVISGLSVSEEDYLIASGKATRLNESAASKNYYPTRDFIVPAKKIGRVDSGAVGGYTWHATIDVPFEFDAVKLRVYNAIASTVASYKAAFAVTDSAVDGTASVITPSTGSWVNATFSSASTVTLAACTGSGSDLYPSIVETDLILTQSIKKANGGSGAFAMWRGYWPTGSGVKFNAAGSGTPSLANSRYWQGFNTGDCITTPASFTDTAGKTWGPAIEPVFYTRNKIKKIYIAGDSTFGGLMDTSTVIGWPWIASKDFYYKDYAFQTINWGWSQQSSVAYLQNFLNQVAYYMPSIAVFCPFSPNDTDKYTSAGESRMLASIGTFISACSSYNVIPIIATPFPKSGLTAPQEASRRKIASEIRAIGDRIIILDNDLLFNNVGSSTGGWVPTSDGDGTHPGVKDSALVASKFRVCLLKAMELLL